MKDSKTEAELEQTKSTKSLKNWVSGFACSAIRRLLNVSVCRAMIP